jgi:large subunit ribosomal protein L4
MKLDVYQKSGKKSTKKATLKSSVFGVEPNEHSIYLAISSEMAAMRQGTHSSKTKGEVRGTGAKPWRQKGTGRSRIGYLRNPSRVHGSKAFGPKPHKYEKKVNRKVKILARKSILSQKIADNNFMIIDELALESPKTKEFASILKNLKIENKKVTILADEVSENLFFGVRNIKNICVISATSASAYDLLDNHIILADLASVETLNKQLAN